MSLMNVLVGQNITKKWNPAKAIDLFLTNFVNIWNFQGFYFRNKDLICRQLNKLHISLLSHFYGVSSMYTLLLWLLRFRPPFAMVFLLIFAVYLFSMLNSGTHFHHIPVSCNKKKVQLFPRKNVFLSWAQI